MRSINSLKQPINPHHYHYIHHQTPHFQPQQQPPLPSDYETRLRDEVLYLHSLWHRGPPRPTTEPNPTTPLFLRPSNPAHFKKSKPKHKHPTSDKPWPVKSRPACPSPTSTPWPDFKPVSKPVSRPATEDEKNRVLGVKIHLKGLDLCSGLVKGLDDEEDDDDEEEDGMVDDAIEYDYLMKVFEENKDLREFYERKCEDGEFYCLICGVLVNQLRKKYKNCVALVQHCVTVSKTKKKAAHRALGHVVCKVLGWDVNRLPSLPLNGGGGDAGGVRQSLSEVQRESKNNTDGHLEVENEGLKTDEVGQNSENVQLENEVENEGLKTNEVGQNSENVQLEKDEVVN